MCNTLLALAPLNIYQCKCSLGEGLLVRDGDAAWVDINSNSIFISDCSEFQDLSLSHDSDRRVGAWQHTSKDCCNTKVLLVAK